MSTRAEHLEYIGQILQERDEPLTVEIGEFLSHADALVKEIGIDGAEVSISDFEAIGPNGRKLAILALITKATQLLATS